MLRKSLVILICLSAGPALAQDESLCPMTDDQNNCVRILACIGTDGDWFHGRAFGRGAGHLVGKISDGRRCTGSWVSHNALGLGQADVRCDGGMSVTVLYTYQDEYTGTAIGRGISSEGEMIKAWSGLHVLDYLRNPDDATAQINLPCGAVQIPIS